MSAFFHILRFELLMLLKRKATIINLLAYFLLVVGVFPFGIGSDSTLISSVGQGIIWVSALLVSMHSLHLMFDEDYEDGMLDQYVCLPYAISAIAGAKMLAHWLSTGVMLALFSPVLCIIMNIEVSAIPRVMLSLFLATPLITIIGAMGVALTLGVKKAGVLVSMLVIPLNVPVLIFANGMLRDDALTTSAFGLLMLVLVMLPLSLISVSAALKMAASDR
ncbi:MAG: heme exporter protein CcmB [Proteobacteria bacterium]|nr:heme exporter protein CcmB [Pseudomonadota bacterium]